jgi:hypothetical protein
LTIRDELARVIEGQMTAQAQGAIEHARRRWAAGEVAAWMVERAEAGGISEATLRNVFVTGQGAAPQPIQGCRCPMCSPKQEKPHAV